MDSMPPPAAPLWRNTSSKPVPAKRRLLWRLMTLRYETRARIASALGLESGDKDRADTAMLNRAEERNKLDDLWDAVARMRPEAEAMGYRWADDGGAHITEGDDANPFRQQPSPLPGAIYATISIPHDGTGAI